MARQVHPSLMPSNDMDNCTEDVLDNRRPLERAMKTRKNGDGGPLSAKDSTQLWDIRITDSAQL